MVEKMTVKEVSDIIGKPPQFVRLGIKQGTLPFGVAVKQKRWSYWISREKFERWLNSNGK
ncbi:hypothetical protein [Gudongella oleilytica]|jgi:hypothetical protein|uniref:hypothetical protein n=1 Tax=Gudongella oleilytica TaxID=1582259 RepID=UPI002A360017|nr:hypothetical protein [Gudongella oleilytica]MDY0257296.1 hypothetical protein [Gudongella oleilytica]